MQSTAPEQDGRPPVEVAVAVIRDAEGRVLLAQRAPAVHQGGRWEFPGGKLEPGETIGQALAREVREELGLDVLAAEPFLRIPWDYPEKRVVLHVQTVTAFAGIPQAREGQPLRWVAPHELPRYTFPAANRAIVTVLRLSRRMLVTGPFLDEADCLARTGEAIRQHGVGSVQLRVPDAAAALQRQLVRVLSPLCRQHGVPLLVNADPLFRCEGIDGLHLSARHLMACPARPCADHLMLGASCHNLAELQQAAAIGVDYVTLSPVMPTASHPGSPALGWDRFSQLAQQSKVPVLALGGLSGQELGLALQAGAHGIAAISAWW